MNEMKCSIYHFSHLFLHFLTSYFLFTSIFFLLPFPFIFLPHQEPNYHNYQAQTPKNRQPPDSRRAPATKQLPTASYGTTPVVSCPLYSFLWASLFLCNLGFNFMESLTHDVNLCYNYWTFDKKLVWVSIKSVKWTWIS